MSLLAHWRRSLELQINQLTQAGGLWPNANKQNVCTHTKNKNKTIKRAAGRFLSLINGKMA